MDGQGRKRRHIKGVQLLASRRVLAFIHISFNASPICKHTPKGNKDVVSMTKDVFYERIEHTYERYTSHDDKIVLSNFKIRVGTTRKRGRNISK